MIKYLTKEQLFSILRMGKVVEQWLGPTHEDGFTFLKWFRVEKEKTKNYSVAYFESFDEGNADFADLYEFSPLYPDKPYGEINSFKSIDQALEFAVNQYHASEDKFVPEGMIQDEYLRYLQG